MHSFLCPLDLMRCFLFKLLLIMAVVSVTAHEKNERWRVSLSDLSLFWSHCEITFFRFTSLTAVFLLVSNCVLVQDFTNLIGWEPHSHTNEVVVFIIVCKASNNICSDWWRPWSLSNLKNSWWTTTLQTWMLLLDSAHTCWTQQHRRAIQSNLSFCFGFIVLKWQNSLTDI